MMLMPGPKEREDIEEDVECKLEIEGEVEDGVIRNFRFEVGDLRIDKPERVRLGLRQIVRR